jgi:hypothetical protein
MFHNYTNSYNGPPAVLLPNGTGPTGLGGLGGFAVAQQNIGTTGAYPQQWTGPMMLMYTPQSPPISPPMSPMSPVAQVGHRQSHGNGILAAGNNIAMLMPNDHQDGADDDERKLRDVLNDASDQIREAKRVVTKSMMRNHKHRSVQVQLLKKLGATAIESIPFTKPKNAYEALQSVSLLISNVSSKLVPEMKQRQKHIVYVMRIMETYVRSMLSFFTKKDRADEDETDEVRSKDAIERILIKLQEAEAWIPPSLTQEQKGDQDTQQNMKNIISLCEKIKEAVIDLRNGNEEADVSGHTARSHKSQNMRLSNHGGGANGGTIFTIDASDVSRLAQKTKED